MLYHFHLSIWTRVVRTDGLRLLVWNETREDQTLIDGDSRDSWDCQDSGLVEFKNKLVVFPKKTIFRIKFLAIEIGSLMSHVPYLHRYGAPAIGKCNRNCCTKCIKFNAKHMHTQFSGIFRATVSTACDSTNYLFYVQNPCVVRVRVSSCVTVCVWNENHNSDTASEWQCSEQRTRKWQNKLENLMCVTRAKYYFIRRTCVATRFDVASRLALPFEHTHMVLLNCGQFTFELDSIQSRRKVRSRHSAFGIRHSK